jgi:hypothetical protein
LLTLVAERKEPTLLKTMPVMIMLLSRSDPPEILLTCLSVIHLNVIFHIHFVPVIGHRPVGFPTNFEKK